MYSEIERLIRCSVIAAALLLIDGRASGAEWVEVRTDNFTVLSDGGAGRARDVAWQFEQVRAAIRGAWPWADRPLDRPVQIVAAADERTMRMLVPDLVSGSDTIPVACLVIRPDRYAIVMRSDYRQVDRAGTINPYFASYAIYSALALDDAFDGNLPRWFVRGLIELLSNTLVADRHIDFGRGHPSTLATLRNEPRQRLTELFAVTAGSDYLNNSINRARFNAQSFGVMHYLLFGLAETRPHAVDEIARRLLEGQTSTEAVTAVFGSVDALETAYFDYQRRPLTHFLRVKIDTRIERSFPVRTLTDAEALTVRAAVHVVYSRAEDAEQLLLEARKSEPAAPDTFLVEGFLHDQTKKPADAAAAYTRAVELGSDSFYAFYRTAADLAERGDPALKARAKAHAERALALNPLHGPSHSLLATLLASGPDPADGLDAARRGVQLEPNRSASRLAFATVLWRIGQTADALGQALAARALARTDDERARAQRLVEEIAPPGPPAQ